MANDDIVFSVFTKPWKDVSVDRLGRLISGFGFDGIEFPLREGFQVEPADAEKGLPRLVEQMAEYNLRIYSVASEPDETVFAGCAAAGIPIIRIMANIRSNDGGYLASVENLRRKLEELVPLCEKYGVKIGIQQHCGNYISDSAGMLRLVESFDPRHIGAIWDAAHDALAGQRPEFGLDIVWSHLCMVNLKNAFYERSNGADAEAAEWKRFFTTGKQGLASWPQAADYLQKRGYRGAICLTAEYSAKHEVESLIQQDLAYAKSLFV